MIFNSNELAQVVFFFDEQGQIQKQMHIAEFQAVLDGFVPLQDLAGTESQACYIDLDSQFELKSTVFFLLPLNSTGAIDRSWHLPLMDLARSAESGEAVGAGDIRFACRSQCPIEGMQAKLWDPKINQSLNQLKAIREALKKNKIGLRFREFEDEPSVSGALGRAESEKALTEKLRAEFAEESRNHMAEWLKEQRNRQMRMQKELEKKERALKLDAEERIQEYRGLLAENIRICTEQSEANRELKKQVEGQAQKIAAMREYYDAKIDLANDDEDETDVKAELEKQNSLEADVKALNDALQMREVELLYRNELEVQLHDELALIREELKLTKQRADTTTLSRLVASGVSFVSFQPGAGHLTIPLDDVQRYLDAPVAYTAEQCGVNEQCYTEWLEHYRLPVCKSQLEDGKVCGENIDRIDAPKDFKVGESDSCTKCQKKAARSHLRVAGE